MLNEPALSGLIEESQDLHSDAMREVKPALAGLTELHPDRRLARAVLDHVQLALDLLDTLLGLVERALHPQRLADRDRLEVELLQRTASALQDLQARVQVDELVRDVLGRDRR